ncbi:MAG: cob(I)yrinic acid a,c-diamide adenosyltransferase [Bacilli bacterium]|nr:cob(I)yrinic acid a,c-diamide adenosyltransferase [Bacilli bacterium]
MLEKGYIQVYTGNGKGKTTAALGQALRAICAGNKVFFGQFLKGQSTSELQVPNYVPNFTIRQFGNINFIIEPTSSDKEKANIAFEQMSEILTSSRYDLVIFDEINTAMALNIIPEQWILSLLKLKPNWTEVILTGRNAPKRIIEIADLVTEMNEIKHYYSTGVKARFGIEY